MKVLHVYNRHRSGGGSDNAWDQTIALSRKRGVDVRIFERDSKDLGTGLAGKVRAFSSGLYAREAVRAFDALLEADPPDIVHTHELYPLISPFVLEVAARRGVPVVHSVYDYRITCPVATHYNGREVCTRCEDRGAHNILRQGCRDSLGENVAFSLRYALARQRDLFRRNITHFIVLTPFSKKWLVERAGVAANRISVNECAIATENPPADPARGVFAGFAGRPVHEKGIDVLLQAAETTGIPIKLALPKGTNIARVGLPPEILTVTQSRADLIAFYRRCRFLVVPSLWFETFAIVAAEAMAEGIPVVASDLGALRDTIVRDETGLHFAPGDASGLAAAMTRLWTDDALVQELGAGARKRVETVLNEDAHFDRLCAAYDTALCAGPPGL
ncbi:glycosyltransferase family 4 protein [Aliiroseovarius sp. PrR006]|uniref:glycosyltransferase family 4 protein n=1 Tax=Aliiroseovarius sp. PrR006 TaxID=2706883 RepID=UPI0013D8B64D|nr:glycosyltransferase family 4 protein [Aliiroseovarius sp. PrR006]NDW52451.1 glycosyltransferase family 4 protein [Aliiroseovarius sp. PrR006]